MTSTNFDKMFLTTEELGIKDFLKAISFIPPKGTSVDYFISPKALNGETVGFAPAESVGEPYENASITYQRIDPAQKLVQADTPEDYADITPLEMPATGPKRPVIPQNTPIETLKCPYRTISDDELGTDLVLTENFGPFYKNTLFHCLKEASAEND